MLHLIVIQDASLTISVPGWLSTANGPSEDPWVHLEKAQIVTPNAHVLPLSAQPAVPFDEASAPSTARDAQTGARPNLENADEVA